MKPSSILLEELSWTEVRDSIEHGCRTVVFSVGAIEQHGPHLPLTVDALIGDHISKGIVENLTVKALVAPTIRPGCSDHHMFFSGTISLRKSTLEMIVEDYIRSLFRHGFKSIVVVITHGGNRLPVRKTLEKCRPLYPENKIILVPSLSKYAKEERFGDLSDPSDTGIHGGISTTSQVLAIKPDLVKMEKAVKELPKIPIPNDNEEFQRILSKKGMKAFTDSGMLGDGTKGNMNYGEEFFRIVAERIARDIERELI